MHLPVSTILFTLLDCIFFNLSHLFIWATHSFSKIWENRSLAISLLIFFLDAL
jgi:hypothetical protein